MLPKRQLIELVKIYQLNNNNNTVLTHQNSKFWSYTHLNKRSGILFFPKVCNHSQITK